MLGEIETDSVGALVISIMGNNMRNLQDRFKNGCKILNNTRPTEQLGDIVLFTPKKNDKYNYLELNQRLNHDRTADVFLINEVNAFSSHDSRPDCVTINLLSPSNAKYQAEASQSDALMHPWKENSASLYTSTITLDLPDDCKAIIMGGVVEYCTNQPSMKSETLP